MSTSQSADWGVTMVGSAAGPPPSVHPTSAGPDPCARATRSVACFAESHDSTATSTRCPDAVSWSSSLNRSAIAGSSPSRIGWLFDQWVMTSGGRSSWTARRTNTAPPSAATSTATTTPRRFTAHLPRHRRAIASPPAPRPRDGRWPAGCRRHRRRRRSSHPPTPKPRRTALPPGRWRTARPRTGAPARARRPRRGGRAGGAGRRAARCRVRGRVGPSPRRPSSSRASSLASSSTSRAWSGCRANASSSTASESALTPWRNVAPENSVSAATRFDGRRAPFLASRPEIAWCSSTSWPSRRWPSAASSAGDAASSADARSTAACNSRFAAAARPSISTAWRRLAAPARSRVATLTPNPATAVASTTAARRWPPSSGASTSNQIAARPAPRRATSEAGCWIASTITSARARPGRVVPDRLAPVRDRCRLVDGWRSPRGSRSPPRTWPVERWWRRSGGRGRDRRDRLATGAGELEQAGAGRTSRSAWRAGQRHDAHVAPDEAEQQLGRRLHRDGRAGARRGAQLDDLVHDRPAVDAVGVQGFADADRGSQANVDVRREHGGGHLVVEGQCRERRRGRFPEGGDGAVALVHRGDDVPAEPVHDRVADIAQAGHRDAHLGGIAAPERAGISHLGGHEGDDAGRQLATPRTAQVGDQPPGAARTPHRVARHRVAQDPRHVALLRRLDVWIGRCRDVGRIAVEQRHGGRREPVDVGGRTRLVTARDLRRHEPDRPHPGRGGLRPGEVEVHEHDPAGGGTNQVRRLHVTVDDRWLVGMEVIERLGRLRQVLDDVLERETRGPVGVEEVLQVGAVDPVHDHHVLAPVIGEQVAAHDRESGMRRHRHQQSGLGQQGVAVGCAGGIDLERHEPVVDRVEGLHDRRAVARADRAQHFVPAADQRRRISHVRRRRPRTPRCRRA